MRKQYLSLAVLWVMGAVLYAANALPAGEEQEGGETFPYIVRVVDIFGNPFRDATLKSIGADQTIKAQGDGLYAWSLPVPDDSVALIYNNDTVCRSTLSSYNKYYFVVDTIPPSPRECLLLPYQAYRTYRENAGTKNRKAIIYYKLGLNYLNGVSGVEQNYSKAFKCFDYAARMGNSNAYVQLAKMYDRGQGVTQNYSEAFRWLNKALEWGMGSIQTKNFQTFYAELASRLGDMYLEGTGVEQSYRMAAFCYRLAAIEGSKTVQKKLKRLYKDNLATPADVPTKAEREKLIGESEDIKDIIATLHAEFAMADRQQLHSEGNAGLLSGEDKYEILATEERQKFHIEENTGLFSGEEHAEFPGGDAACFEWFAKNINYPSICRELGVQGLVIVCFAIETDGSVADIEVFSSPHPALAKEAIRMIRSMPKWKSAVQDGKPVRSRFTCPIMFRLTE